MPPLPRPAPSLQVQSRPVPLQVQVATKAYLRGGKDGFDALKHSVVLVDGETAPRLATLVQYLLSRIQELNCLIMRAESSADEDEALLLGRGMLRPAEVLGACAHGLEGLIQFDPVARRFGIEPHVEGRIIRVGP